ncbi:glycerol-3-phosphate dehydrogenase/oxidase [Aeromicrobium sp.]
MSLNAVRRERELAEATDGRVVDVLVVGLGVTGAGAALDAASRGLSVAAVDAHDLAFGTSRWSSKLVHGGLRYLAKGQFGVAHESAVERGILMTTTAPHLIRPLPMLIPLTPLVSPSMAVLARAGILAGDKLRYAASTTREQLPRPRRLSATETLRMARGVRQHDLRGGLLSWDGQLEDDARLVVALARTAAGLGARILTRCRATTLHGDGAEIRDEQTGSTSSIKARTVINATGVWAAGLVPGIHLRPSRGSHLVLRAAALGNPSVALMAPIPGEGNRFVFALPQPDGLVYVGLTDEPAEGPVPDVPQPTDGEIGFLLDVINGVLEHPVDREDVVGSYAGLRPLLDAAGRTADISREHAVLTSPEGVVTIIGGKLTTYRRMAEDALDTALGQRDIEAPPCRTASLPLVGAGSTATLTATGVPERLIRRYGTEAGLVAADRSLLEPISESIPVTLAELRWGVEHEVALDADDLLDRRTRIGLVPADRAVALPSAEAALS